METPGLSRSSNNFDALRLLAATFVLIGHSAPILLNRPLDWDPYRQLLGIGIHFIGVLIFFVLSGFLVTHSWYARKNIFSFLSARVLRIFPALIGVVLLSVFVLGASLTTYSLGDYLFSETTGKYLQDMTLYRMYYYLPGVFENNPIGSSVNGSLWTLPYEFTCYLFLALLGLLAAFKNKWGYLVFTVALTLGYILWEAPLNRIVIPILGIDFKNFLPLLPYFMAGSVYYHFRNSFSMGWAGWLLCCAAIVLIKFEYLPNLLYAFLFPFFIFQFAFSQKINLYHAGKFGDFSYGLYLYTFPVQQLIVWFLPVKINTVWMIFLSLLCTLPFAVLSWYCIERPALKLKGRLVSALG